MFKQLIMSLLERWYWVVLGLLLGGLATAWYLAKTPQQFTSTSSLLIKQQTASLMQRDQVDAIDLRSQEAMNTITARLTRRELLNRVAARPDIRQLSGLIPPPVEWLPTWLHKESSKSHPAGGSAQETPSPEELGGRIGEWLTVSVRRGTRLLDISVTHPVPEVAKRLADAIAGEFLTEIANDNTLDRSKSIVVLETKSTEARASLRSAGSTLAIYARAIEVSKALDQKEAEAAALQRRYLLKHPKMVAINAEILELKEAFSSEFEIARQATNDQWVPVATRKELPDRESNPDDYIRAARQQLLAHIGVLESEIRSSTLVFNSMLTRIQEASVNREAEESSAELSESADLPGAPTAPVARKVLGCGVLAGLAAGVLLALLLSRLDNKFHTVSQISEASGICVLGAVSDIKLHQLALAEKHYRKRNPDEKSVPHELWDKRIVFRPGCATTSYAEMFRSLRASISLLGDEKQRKITLFSSALPGEGKTLTSANFAVGAASQGRKTLLIDLDLRKPSVHNVFGLARDQGPGGITECLANIAPFEEVVFRDTGHENLHLILSGKRAPNPGELLECGRLKAILARACQDYDVVVLDTAPVLPVSDTRIIAPLAHNFCLVTKAEYVPKGAVRRTLMILAEDGIIPSGIIFNGYKERRYLMDENYSYGYYKPSHHGNNRRYSYNSYGYGEA